MKRFFKYAFIFTLSASVFTACTDDDDDSVTPNNNGGTNVTPNEEEVITTVGVITSTQAGVAQDTIYFRDLDGDGGNPPTIDTLRIPADSTFRVNLIFFDESDPNDVENKTAEIQNEDDEHFVCYELRGNSSGISVTYLDQDANNLDLGLSTEWTSTGNSNGTIRITLRHQDGGVKDGTCAPGDTDVEVDFPYTRM